MVVTQLCLTLCDAMDCSLPGSSVLGILQARILEWVAMPPPGDLPFPGIKPKSPVLQAYSLLSAPPGKPNFLIAKSTPLFFLKIETTGTHILDNRGPGDVIIVASIESSSYLGWTHTYRPRGQSLRPCHLCQKSSGSKREARPAP